MEDAQAGPPNPPTTLLDPIPNIIQVGSLNLLAGASGIGKTAFLSWMVRQFELGAPIFGHATNKPPAIGYISADRAWKTNRHWFDASGVQTLKTFSLIDDHTMKLPTQRMKHQRVDFFKSCVARLELPPGALLITDPIALFLGGNLLDYDTVGFACIEIQRWLQLLTTQYATIGLCHSAKQKADKGDRYLRLQDRISGSMAQLGYTSTQMFLAGPEETGDKDGRYTFMWNPHTAPAEVFQFHKGSNGLFLTDSVQRVKSGEEELDDMEAAYVAGTELAPLDQAILAAIPYDAPISTHTFLIALGATPDGASRATVFRALKRLVAWGLATKTAHGMYQRVDLAAKTTGETPP